MNTEDLLYKISIATISAIVGALAKWIFVVIKTKLRVNKRLKELNNLKIANIKNNKILTKLLSINDNDWEAYNVLITQIISLITSSNINIGDKIESIKSGIGEGKKAIKYIRNKFSK